MQAVPLTKHNSFAIISVTIIQYACSPELNCGRKVKKIEVHGIAVISFENHGILTSAVKLVAHRAGDLPPTPSSFLFLLSLFRTHAARPHNSHVRPVRGRDASWADEVLAHKFGLVSFKYY